MNEQNITTTLKNFIGKSLYDMMMSIESIECYIISIDSDYIYPYLSDFGKNILTIEGHKKWDSLLKSYIISNYDINKIITIYVTNPNSKGDDDSILCSFEMDLQGESDIPESEWYKLFSH